jgi:hypothetical protein
MKPSALLATLVACTTPTLALAAGWGAQTTITGFSIDPPTGMVVLKAATNQNIDNCASSVYLMISGTDPNRKELYATLMAAHLAGSTVSLYYDGCLGNYPQIKSIAVPAIW